MLMRSAFLHQSLELILEQMRSYVFASRGSYLLLYLEELVKKELGRREDMRFVAKLDSSEWATPIVVVHKPNRKVRICGDYGETLNPHISSSVTEGLDIEDTIALLSRCRLFSKTDVQDAYLQVPLNGESQLVTVLSTPFGLYKYLKLPFEVCSSYISNADEAPDEGFTSGALSFG